MRIKVKKCDRCLKKRKCKRFFLGSQFPNYYYIGFDLCSECELKLKKYIIRFLKMDKEDKKYLMRDKKA
jgi:hypothetical protein